MQAVTEHTGQVSAEGKLFVSRQRAASVCLTTGLFRASAAWLAPNGVEGRGHRLRALEEQIGLWRMRCVCLQRPGLYVRAVRLRVAWLRCGET